jgi:hypothetical protein
MTDRPIDLDHHRGMSAQKATEQRRERQDVAASEAALQVQRDALEAAFADAPATTWPELVKRVRYLVELFAATAEGQDERRQKFIASVLDDLARLAP